MRSIKDLGKALLKKKIYIFLITLIFIITGIAYNLTNIKYKVVTKILLGTEVNNELAYTYKEFIKGSSVLEEVISNLDEDITAQELSKVIDVNIIENTNMLEIKVVGENEEQIKKYSDELLKVFTARLEDVYGNDELYIVDNSSNYSTDENIVSFAVLLGIAGFLFSNIFLQLYLSQIQR